MINNERTSILEEEFLLVRHSGEIPEVALHGSLHYLCEDTEGPRLILAAEELKILEEAALARYREIILRDLDASNRDRSLFRGIRRANHNWYRFVRFSDRVGCAYDDFRVEAAYLLLAYLRQEKEEVEAGKRLPSCNCTAEALLAFAFDLGIVPTFLPTDWQILCEKTA